MENHKQMNICFGVHLPIFSPDILLRTDCLPGTELGVGDSEMKKILALELEKLLRQEWSALNEVYREYQRESLTVS